MKPADPDFISFDAVAGAQEDESDDDYVPQGEGTEDDSSEVFQKRKSEPVSPKKSSSNEDEKPTKETSTRTSKRISKRTLKSKPATEGNLFFNLIFIVRRTQMNTLQTKIPKFTCVCLFIVFITRSFVLISTYW